MLLCGGALPDGIRPPAGVQVLALPPLGVGASGGFVSHDPRYSVEQAWAVRRERILAAYRAVRPAAVVVELFPFGRAKFARELVPLLEAARADGALTACCCATSSSARAPTSRRHDDRAAARARAHLDAVLVHSDPGFARLEETFSPRQPLRVPVHYTGFVVRDGVGPASARGAHVVVSAGGGLVGEPLLRAAAEAQPEAGVPLRLIAGPLLPDAAWERLRALAGPEVELRRTVADLGAELRAARASVSQARLQHRARGRPHRHAGPARALRDAGGGRAAPPRPPARAPRRGARAGAGAAVARDAGRRAAAAAGLRAAPGGGRPRRRAADG